MDKDLTSIRRPRDFVITHNNTVTSLLPLTDYEPIADVPAAWLKDALAVVDSDAPIVNALIQAKCAFPRHVRTKSTRLKTVDNRETNETRNSPFTASLESSKCTAKRIISKTSGSMSAHAQLLLA